MFSNVFEDGVQDATTVKSNRHPVPNAARRGRHLAEARQLFVSGLVEQAERTLQTLISENPGDKEVLLALGIVASETGRRELAADWIRQALEIDPRYSPALCCMSVLLLQSDRPDDARRYAEGAVSADPHIPDTHAALARCLLKLGIIGEAVSSFRVAIRLNPNDPGLLIELADALLALRSDWEAADLLKKAVQLVPDPRALVNLAYLELQFGKVEEAERHCRRALKRNPDLSPAHSLLARILTEACEFEQAEAHWRRAGELDPNPASILIEKALSLSAIGRFDDAVEELRHSIELEPAQGAAYQALVFSKRVNSGDLLLVTKMQELLSANSLQKSERLNLLYSLGKAHDNLGDFEAAIGYFDRANSLRKQIEGSREFHREAFKALIDAKISGFTAEFFEQRAFSGAESDLPILVVGMMRSGTTLVEQILSSHAHIGGAGEQDYWADDGASTVSLPDRASLQRLAEGYVERLKRAAPGFPKVVDKNPANLQVLGSVHTALPNARIILTRRSAVDTALSIWMTPMITTAGFVGDRSDIVFAIKECLRLADHWCKVLPADRFMEIHYEDLAAHPDLHTPRLVEFCGLDWDEACLHPELNQRPVRTPSLWQVRQPIHTSSTDKWKRYAPWLGEFQELVGLS